MNSKAKDLGMDSTQFTNPIGLDGAHFSTAHDLYILTKYVLKNPLFRDIVDRKEYAITTLDKSFTTTVLNTNRLLWDIPGSVGVKTGRTQEAGEVLIYEYSKGSRDIVIIVMGSVDRFKDTSTILSWVLNVYKWE
jgi:D-alanyl-D-alanine carboxypeptidase (penicillin-binding protein 5/6)